MRSKLIRLVNVTNLTKKTNLEVGTIALFLSDYLSTQVLLSFKCLVSV